MQVTKQQVQKAKHTNLYNYLVAHYQVLHRIYYDSLRPYNHKTISIKQGYCGYKDFKTGETGDSIEYLVKYLGYSFQEAVLALINDKEQVNIKSECENEKENIALVDDKLLIPEKFVDNFRVIEYLNKQRCISLDIVNKLIEKEILYEDVRHNCVFVDKQKSFVELRGTMVDKSYHGVAKGSRKDGFWYVNDFRKKNEAGEEKRKADYVVVCECAIDALSCMELTNLQGKAENRNITYVSIAGVGKQGAIDKLKRAGKNVIIAVDNDEAGNMCRNRNKECKSIVPPNGFKDWNEYLVSVKRKCKN